MFINAYTVFHDLAGVVIYGMVASLIVSCLIAWWTGGWRSTPAIISQAVTGLLLALSFLFRMLSRPLDQQNSFDVFAVLGLLTILLFRGTLATLRRRPQKSASEPSKDTLQEATPDI